MKLDFNSWRLWSLNVSPTNTYYHIETKLSLTYHFSLMRMFDVRHDNTVFNFKAVPPLISDYHPTAFGTGAVREIERQGDGRTIREEREFALSRKRVRLSILNDHKESLALYNLA